MFCSCSNRHFQVKPNTNVCPVCLGLPGSLPVPNKKAIDQTIAIALAFNCQIEKNFWFDRKNYFYPDLPKGYQISQQFAPIGKNGEIPILTNGQFKKIGIDNIHLEEDTGKLIHQKEKTLVDFNRSGVPLVEIVSKPELHSTEETKEYLKRVRQTIRWLGFSDCDMEKGSMRLEANISLSKDENQLPDYKVEIKNLNSFRFVERAINYEIIRQTKILEKGKKPVQETRGFDLKRELTFSQRTKEVAKDYRYFPEPDIPPFKVTNQELNKISGSLGKMPWHFEKKIINQGIKWQWAKIISQNKKMVLLFLETVRIGKKQALSAQDVAKWLVNKKTPAKIKPIDLARLITRGKKKFTLSLEEIIKIIKKIIGENPKAVEDYQKGKTQVIGFLIGQVQKKAKGKASPVITRKTLLKILNDKL